MNLKFTTYLFLFFFIVSILNTVSLLAQTLTISSTGQVGTSGTNWTSTGTTTITITFTGTAAINTSVVEGHLNSGRNVTVQNGVGGSDIILSNDITATSSQSLVFKSSGSIRLNASVDITTTGGNVTLWADSDVLNGGNISLMGSASIITNGGSIILGGGADDGSNSGAANDGIPDGFARGVGNPGISTINSFTLSAGAGNILLRGSTNLKDGVLLSASSTGDVLTTSGNIDILGRVDNATTNSDVQNGIRTTQGGIITIGSETGTINLDGKAPRYGIGFGIDIIQTPAYNSDGLTRTVIKSGNTSSSAITVIGEGLNGFSHGLSIRGASTRIHATGSQGGIRLNGNSTNWTTVIYCPFELLAVSGPIIWSNTSSVSGIGFYSQASVSPSLTIGSRAGVAGLTTSSSNVTFNVEKFTSASTISIGTTGTVSVLGVNGTASFGQTFNSNIFTFNANSQTMTGLNFGSPNNNSGITIGAPITCAGPVNVNGGAIAFNNNISATGDLTFSGSSIGLSSPITLVNNDIIIGSNTTLTTSSTNYFRTTGTGSLKRTLGSGSSFTFPVGNSAYNPVTITNNSGASDVFSVRVADEVLVNGVAGTPITDRIVNRTWHIDKALANAGSGVNFTFQWSASEERGTLTDYKLSHFGNNSWGLAAGTSGAVSGSTTKTMTHSGYTGSFSPFAIGSSTSALPVSWQSFQGKKVQQGVALDWSTSSEQNTKDFEVQYSINGQEWSPVGSLPAAGNSNTIRTYRYVHMGPFKNSVQHFYRILQRDLDNKFSYSKVIKVEYPQTEASFIFYPNPASNVLNIHIKERQTLRLMNLQGVVVWKAELPAGHHEISLSNIASGQYMFQTASRIYKLIIQ